MIINIPLRWSLLTYHSAGAQLTCRSDGAGSDNFMGVYFSIGAAPAELFVQYIFTCTTVALKLRITRVHIRKIIIILLEICPLKGTDKIPLPK